MSDKKKILLKYTDEDGNVRRLRHVGLGIIAVMTDKEYNAMIRMDLMIIAVSVALMVGGLIYLDINN